MQINFPIRKSLDHAGVIARTPRDLCLFMRAVAGDSGTWNAAAIEAGVDSILTAHVVADAVDDAPVSVSRFWSDHLRAMGFEGAIITDALDMDAVAEGRAIAGVADAAVRALGAGADTCGGGSARVARDRSSGIAAGGPCVGSAGRVGGTLHCEKR